jgi:ATP synthase F1, delta subunit
VKKVSKTKIAVTYAIALYEAAAEKKAVDKVFADVKVLGSIARQESDLVKYLANPIWDDADKKEALRQVAEKLKLSKETLRCLDIVADNHRFGELLLILQEFVHIYYQRNNMQEVEVESVKELSAAQDKKLQANLEKVLGKKVVVSYKIRPELIGGLRIKFGSEMIDNSVISKLNRLENVMKGVQ